jgi:predicted AAA+ superfamily ATPase
MTAGEGRGGFIPRQAASAIQNGLTSHTCVLLVGPSEGGKSELLRSLYEIDGRAVIYVDARSLSGVIDLAALAPSGEVVVIDHLDAKPDVLDTIRYEIERGASAGESARRFVLGGADADRATELVATALGTRSLRIPLSPINLTEFLDAQWDPPSMNLATGPIGPQDRVNDPEHLTEMHWERGGYPSSLLAVSREDSLRWRRRYIEDLSWRYASRHPETPAPSAIQFLEQRALNNGELWNGHTARGEDRVIAKHLEGLGIVRELRPWMRNEGKRFEKQSKLYLRDSGLLHVLLHRDSLTELRTDGERCGHSWEGYCLENLLVALEGFGRAHFYRDDQQREIDLLIEWPGSVLWALEMKAGDNRLTASFHGACEFIGVKERFSIRPAGSYAGGSGDAKTLSEAISHVRAYKAPRDSDRSPKPQE